MRILNLTQHPATAEQKADGVFDMEGDNLRVLVKTLTFNEPPVKADMQLRAYLLAMKVSEYGDIDGVMIGGAPFFMSTLEEVLRDAGIPYAYAFSKRVSEERTLADGTVEKVNRFAHAGWVVP